MLIIAKPRVQTALVKIVNNNQSLLPISQTPMTLGIVSPVITTLKDLSDVNEGTPANNATLTFNSTTQKFDVNVIVIDGGSF